MKSTQGLSDTDYRQPIDDHFYNKFSESLIEERNERRRTYITAGFIVVCVLLIAVQFL